MKDCTYRLPDIRSLCRKHFYIIAVKAIPLFFFSFCHKFRQEGTFFFYYRFNIIICNKHQSMSYVVSLHFLSFLLLFLAMRFEKMAYFFTVCLEESLFHFTFFSFFLLFLNQCTSETLETHSITPKKEEERGIGQWFNFLRNTKACRLFFPLLLYYFMFLSETLERHVTSSQTEERRVESVV